MKKLLMLALSALALNLFALDIYGLWEITSDVTLNEDLHILPGGTIQPYNGHPTLTVNGNIINEGTIQDHPTIGYTLTVNCTGGITNYGAVTNNIFKLTGSMSQSLHCTSTTPFSPYYFSVENTNKIVPISDVYFESSRVSFPNGGGFDLSGGFGLILKDGYLTGATVTGDASQFPKPYIQLQDGAYINNSTLHDLSIWGTLLFEDNVTITGDSENNGVIKSWMNTLTTEGSFINNGTITDNPPYQTYVDAKGHFENRGTVDNARITCYSDFVNSSVDFTPYFLYFSGSNVQNVYTSFSWPIKATYTTVTNTSGILAKYDLHFENSYIDFTGNTLDLREGFGMYVSGGYMYRMNILGAGTEGSVSYLGMSDGCYIESSTLSDVLLTGTTNISNDVVFYNKTVNQGIIQNRNSNQYTLLVNGDFENNGTIIDNPEGFYFFVDFKGDSLYNAGIWGGYMLTLSGSAVQNISNAYGYPFSPQYTSVSNSSGILAKTDLYFYNSLINFTDNTLDLREGRNLYVSGGYINRLNLLGAGTEAKAVSNFDMSGGCYIQNSTLTDLALTGVTDVDENNKLEGKVINNGTIQNKNWYWYTLTVNGDFENNGQVINNPGGWSLNVDFKGDSLYNAGIWGGYMLTLSGSAVQNISNAYGYPFSPEYTSVSNSSGIIAKTDLYFENSLINFTDNTLDLRENRNLYVSGGYINRLNLLGAGTQAKAVSNFDMSNGCYIQNSTLTDLALTGVTDVDENNKLEGKVINTGTVQNKSWYWYTLTVNGDFENAGTVTDNPGGYVLYVNVKGNITNKGTWVNYGLDFDSDSNQHITILNGSAIASPITYFRSNISNGPFEWMYNGVAIEPSNTDFSYEDSQDLRWDVPLTDSYTGTFYCETGEGRSRSIYINFGPAPVITGGGYENGISTIYWENIPLALTYKVYSSADPYADPSTWTFEAEVVTNECQIIDQTENKKFYFVTAVY